MALKRGQDQGPVQSIASCFYHIVLLSLTCGPAEELNLAGDWSLRTLDLQHHDTIDLMLA